MKAVKIDKNGKPARKVRFAECPWCNHPQLTERGDLQVCGNPQCCMVFDKTATRSWLQEPDTELARLPQL